MTTDLEQLPELPARVDLYSTTTGRGWGYTADQMREYGEACAAQFRAELDRIEELGTPWVPELLEWLGKHDCCPELPFTDYELIEALEARFGEAALSQPAGVAEPNGKLVGWWNGIKPDVTERSPYGPSVRWGADAEDRAHDIPLYDGYNPVHFTKPTLPSVEAFASAVWRDWMTNEQADKLGAELHAWLKAHIAAAPAASGGEESIAWTEKERRAIADMMATQEFSYTALMRQAIRLYQHNLLRLKDGETCTWSGDAQRAREFAGMSQPPAGASVSERARIDILALEVARRFTQDTEPQRRASLQAAVIEAIERALSSPRQEGDSTAASTQGLRELVQRWRDERQLPPLPEAAYAQARVCARELESLLTSPTTGADGVKP
jgi:uncharacterized protein (DUF2267 family)